MLPSLALFLVRLCVFERPATGPLVSTGSFGYSSFLGSKHEAGRVSAAARPLRCAFHIPPATHRSQCARAQLTQGKPDLRGTGILHIGVKSSDYVEQSGDHHGWYGIRSLRIRWIRSDFR